MKYDLTPVSMATISKSTSKKCWKGCEKSVPSFSDGNVKLVQLQPLWKTVWRYLRKLKLPCDPVIPLLGIYPDRIFIQKGTCTPMLSAALFTIAKTWKQRKCPLTDDGIILLSHKMEYNSSINERTK